MSARSLPHPDRWVPAFAGVTGAERALTHKGDTA